MSNILQIFTNYYREFQIDGFNGPFDPSNKQSSIPWQFIDLLDGPIDPFENPYSRRFSAFKDYLVKETLCSRAGGRIY